MRNISVVNREPFPVWLKRATSHCAQDSKKPKAELKPITIKKRLDWASTSLFTKCCEAAASTTKKTDGDDDEKGRIKDITIEVCRQSDTKFPFLKIKYTGVTIVKYGLDMSGPEPSESITFKAETMQFEYQRTHPETGAKQGGPVRTGKLESYTPGQDGGGAAGAAAAAAVAAAGMGDDDDGGAGGGLDGNGTDGEGLVNSNFPGLLTTGSLGLLPD